MSGSGWGWQLACVNSYEHATVPYLGSQAQWAMLGPGSIAFVTQHDVVWPEGWWSYLVVSQEGKSREREGERGERGERGGERRKEGKEQRGAYLVREGI